MTPIPAYTDNYIWLIQQHNQAVCIDPGEAAPVLEYLHAHGVTLAQIWITHAHGDHTAGIAELKQHFSDCLVYGAEDIPQATRIVREGDSIAWQNHRARVWHTAGHTARHRCYLLNNQHLFTGDTLFAAGCGRVFPNSRPQWLYHSLQRIFRLPDATRLYPAHEYTAANLRFAAHIEPHNPEIAHSLAAAVHTPTLPVSLAHERQINPFLRTADFQVASRTAELSGQSLHDEEQVFTALRELKNHF